MAKKKAVPHRCCPLCGSEFVNGTCSGRTETVATATVYAQIYRTGEWKLLGEVHNVTKHDLPEKALNKYPRPGEGIYGDYRFEVAGG